MVPLFREYLSLKGLEQALNTDVRYFLKGGSFLTLERLVAAAVTFGLGIAFANLMTPESFGTYRYVLLVAGILSLPTLPGINAALARSVARGAEGSLIAGLKTKARWGLLGTLGTLAMAGYYYLQGNTELALGFTAGALLFPLAELFTLIEALLIGRKLFKTSFLYTLLTHIAAGALIAATLFSTHNVVVVLMSFFGSWTLVRLAAFVLLLRRYPPNDIPDPDAVTYGKHLSLMKALGTASGTASHLALFHFAGGQALANFFFAIAPIEQARGLLTSLENLLAPKAAQDTWRVGRLGLFFRKSAPLFGLVTLGVLVYIAVAPSLFAFLFPRYHEVVWLSQLYAPSLVPTLFIIIGLTILRAKRMLRAVYLMSTSDVVLNFALLVPAALWGAPGLVGGLWALKIIEVLLLAFLLFPLAPEVKKPVQDGA